MEDSKRYSRHLIDLTREKNYLRNLLVKYLTENNVSMREIERRINSSILIHNIIESLYTKRIIDDENLVQNGEEGSTG